MHKETKHNGDAGNAARRAAVMNHPHRNIAQQMSERKLVRIGDF